MRLSSLGALALTTTLLGACASTPFAGYSSDTGAWSATIQDPFLNGGNIDPAGYKRLNVLRESCHEQISGYVAGPGQSAATGTVIYGGGGYVGGKQGAKQALTAVMRRGVKYGPYVGIPNAINGGISGSIGGAYSSASAKGNCTDKLWPNHQKTDPKWEGLYPITITAGKKPGARPLALQAAPRPVN